MKRIGEMWRNVKGRGGAVARGSFLGDIVSFGHMLGLGMEKRKRVRSKGGVSLLEL